MIRPRYVVVLVTTATLCSASLALGQTCLGQQSFDKARVHIGGEATVSPATNASSGSSGAGALLGFRLRGPAFGELAVSQTSYQGSSPGGQGNALSTLIEASSGMTLASSPGFGICGLATAGYQRGPDGSIDLGLPLANTATATLFSAGLSIGRRFHRASGVDAIPFAAIGYARTSTTMTQTGPGGSRFSQRVGQGIGQLAAGVGFALNPSFTLSARAMHPFGFADGAPLSNQYSLRLTWNFNPCPPEE